MSGMAVTASAEALQRASFLPQPPDDGQYTILSERVAYSRYMTVYDRSVQFPPDGKGDRHVFDYDVLGHPRAHFHCVWVLPFWPDGTVTLVREYAQGANTVVWSLPAGGVDPAKHSSLEAAARAELSEEARLRCGELVRLLPPTHPGMLEAKWCANRWTPFIALQLSDDHAPGERDAEEAHLTTHRVPVAELERLMAAGEFLPPAHLTASMALAELRRRGLLPVAC